MLSRLAISQLRAGAACLRGRSERLFRPVAVAAGAVQSRDLTFKAPSRDMKFVLNEVLEVPEEYKKMGFPDANAELVDSVIEHFEKFSEEQLFPLYEVRLARAACPGNGRVNDPRDHPHDADG